MRNIKNIFIHCTATPQSATPESITEGFRKRGWKRPGYHYLIEPDGRVRQLLDITQASNGVQGHNANAINIAYIGGVAKDGTATDNRTVEQKAAIVHLLLQLRETFPTAHIMGHRDIWSQTDSRKWKKQCPCFNASREYKYI